MQNSTIRFFGSLAFVLVLTLVLLALNQSLSNDVLLALMDANAIAIDGVMTPFVLDTPVALNEWGNVSCSDLNKLTGNTVIDFSDKALLSKLEFCNNYQ